MGFILCWLYISHIWKKNFSGYIGRFNQMILQKEVIYFPSFPSDCGFASLKWSAARHGFIFLVFSLLIYFVNLPILNSVLLALNLLYASFKVCLQINRNRTLRKTGAARAVLALACKASTALTIYCGYLQIALFIVYAIRPQ